MTNHTARCRLFLLPAALVVGLLLTTALSAQPPEEPTADQDSGGVLSARVDAESDQAIADGLERRYDQIEGLESLEVSVRAGVVTVRGQVFREDDREEAVRLARRTASVASVRDEIEVVVDLKRRLAPTFDQAIERLRTMVTYLPLLLVALAIAFVFYLLSRLVGRTTRVFARLSSNRFAQDLLRQAAQVAVLLLGILIALEILDATALVGAVLGAAGVVGLALGFAFRDLVENYVSSILLSIRQPFAPNDHVVINDHEGKVVRLTSRATVLMTLDGNHLRIPNAQVFKGIILNYTRNPRRRFAFGVGVGVGEDLVAAQQIGIAALDAMPGVLADPPTMAQIEELGDSNVLIRFYGWVDQREASFNKVKGEAIRQVKTVLEEAGMDLPEPIYRVHLKEAAAVREESEPSAPADTSPRPAADIEPERHLDDEIAQERAEADSGRDLLDDDALIE